MTNTVKINRARRNLLKIAGTTAAAIVGATGPAKAQWHHGGGGGGTDGSCFLRGTLVRTAEGYRAIETLKAGGEVAARFAGLTRIRAVSRFTLARVSGEWVGPSRPVCVKRNALGENMPVQDLCLTASHAVVVDGALVPVGNLVNGTSIVFETADGHDTLEFFHIELERHDVLDVQGAPCESLRRPAVEPCLPLLGFNGHRGELRSRLRSALSLVVDRRQPLDIIRDTLEERGLELARAA
jgi:Hint domain-containing protein